MRLMRVLGIVLGVCLAAASADAIVYTGNGGVWVLPRATFNSINKPGTDVGIQQASDESNGGRVQVGAGRYAINFTEHFNDAGMELYGAGDSTVWVNNASSGDTMCVVDQPNVTLRDLRFEGLNPTKQTGIGIYVNAANVTIRRVHFVNMPETAIRLGPNAIGTKVEGCRIEGVADADTDDDAGISIVGTQGATISGNTISGTRGYPIEIIGGARNIEVNTNRILGSLATTDARGDGVYVDSTTYNVSVIGNFIRNVIGDGVEMSADSSQVIGNTILSCTYGVHTKQGGLHMTYKDNLIGGTQVYGMYLEFVNDGVWGVDVRGNTIISPGANAIHVETQRVSGDVTIEGNTFYGGVNSSLSTVRILSVNNGQWHRLTVRNNRIYGSKRSGIQFLYGNGTGFWSNAVIENNVIFNPTNYGIETPDALAASSARISGNTVVNPGLGEMNLSNVNWTYEGVGKNTTRASLLIAEDSLRVGKTTKLGIYTAATLPSASDGLIVYCDDCTKTTPCGTGGSGAFAFGVNGTWDCMAPGGGGGGDSTNLAYLPGRPNGQVVHGSSATLTGGNTYLGLRGFTSASAALIKLNTGIDMTGITTISDTLRLASNLDLSSGDIRMKNNRWLYGRNSVNALVPLLKADSANTVRLHTITGGNFDVFRTDGTLHTRFYGTGHVSIAGDLQLGGFKYLTDADPDRYVVNRNASGGIAFRPFANDRHSFYIKNGGAAWGAQSITAKDTLVAEALLHAKTRALVADSLRVNKKGIFDLGLNLLGDSWIKGRWTVGDSLRVNGAANFDAGIKATGNSWVSGLFSAKDSLRVNGPARFDAGVFSAADGWTSGSETVLDTMRVIGILKVGSKSGLPNRHIIGTGGTTAAESLTVVFNGQGSVATQYSPKLEFQRNGAPAASISFNGVNFTSRIDGAANKFFRWGTLGSETSQHIMTLDNTGRLEIGSGTPDKALEVTGAGSFTDSLRANKGIYIGGQLVNRVLRASASLNFDLTSVVSQDLTITVTGAADGDEVMLGVPSGSVSTDVTFFAFATTNTVTVRAVRHSGTPDPAAGTFKVTVLQ